MDVGPPSTSSAPPLETTNKTPISTELSLAVQFKAASQDPNTIEDSMDIGSPSACSTLQLGTIDWDLKAAESPLIPSAQSLNTASQDLTAIKNLADLEAPSAPTNQDSTTDKQAPMVAKPSSPSSVLHLEPLSEKTLAPPPAGPSGISLTKVCEPEWVEKMTSHGSSLYEHKIAKKIKRLLPPSSPSPHMPTSVPMSTSTRHQWINTLSTDYSHPVESTHLTFSWTFTDTLYEHYGFLDLSDTTNIPFPEKDWKFITHTFRHPSDTEKTNALHGAVSLFLSNMLSKTPPPSFIWDIGECCDMLLAETSQGSPFRVLPIIIEGCHHYVVSSKAVSTVPWVLEFRDPATVLQCFRQQETMIPELAQFLSHYRAAFTTRLCGSQIASSLAPRHHRQVELGWRMPLHHGTVLEYNFYVESHNQLPHCPYGCAALLEGGIIWRLAADGLGSLSESLVLDGPSLDVLQHGHAVKCGNNKQNWLWDDALSDQDRDIICGVYKVYTSQFFSLRLS